jgi:exodeoxyribonuclease VII small subunit
MESEPNFEAALNQLERIVDDLERGAPDLSEALAKYEQGVRLLAQCHGVLDQAERSVALLTGVDAAGNAVTMPFDPPSTPPEIEIAKVPAVPTSRRKRRPESTSDHDDSQIPF